MDVSPSGGARFSDIAALKVEIGDRNLHRNGGGRNFLPTGDVFNGNGAPAARAGRANAAMSAAIPARVRRDNLNM